jgi:hypothetical protein
MAQDISKKKVVISDVTAEATQQKEEGQKGSKNKTGIKPLWIVVSLLLIVTIGASVFFYSKYQDLKNNPKEAIAQKNSQETERVLSQLREVLLITETDAPTVARIEDPAKLQASNADFYRDAVEGDYLIIFPKRAIIFRESNGQIINIAPIINTSDLNTSQPTPPTQETEDNR